MNKLKVTSIFLSVDGEVNQRGQGGWSTFLRFAGCSAACLFCDTKYSWGKGKEMSVDDILEEIEKTGKGVKKITITGGEPLEQDWESLRVLIHNLCSMEYEISIETNGLHDVKKIEHATLPISLSDYRGISFILDWKLTSAGGVSELVNPEHYKHLSYNNFIKFVIGSRVDFEEALAAVKSIRKDTYARIYFSPCIGSLDPGTLFNWMKDGGCPEMGVGYNLQLHKFLFSEDWRDEEE